MLRYSFVVGNAHPTFPHFSGGGFFGGGCPFLNLASLSNRFFLLNSLSRCFLSLFFSFAESRLPVDCFCLAIFPTSQEKPETAQHRRPDLILAWVTTLFPASTMGSEVPDDPFAG